MIELFHTLFYQPLMNILIFLCLVIPGGDFGIAIIILTFLIRLLLFPFSAKGIKSQKVITELQPEIKELQEKYKNDKERQVKEVLEVYKRAKVNPFSGFVPLLIQLPVLIALYQVLLGVQGGEFANILYSFMPYPGEINSVFLGFVDLAKVGIFEADGGVFLFGNMLIIAGAGLAQFFQMKMTMAQKLQTKKKKSDPRADMAEKMQKQMIYFFPFFTIFILFSLPLAIGLYWLVSTLFSIVQQYFIINKA